MTESEVRENSKSRSAGLPKVKISCKSCRIQGLKCDEEQPQCNECVRSGRVCDGFPARERLEVRDTVPSQPNEDFNWAIPAPGSQNGPNEKPTDDENQPVSSGYTSPEDLSSQAIYSSSPISLLANHCLGLFQKLGDISPNSQLEFDLETVQGTVEDAKARFKAWGTNIAAFRNGKLRTSLDFRLSEAPGIRNTILQILKDLKEYLRESNLILSGHKTNQIWNLDDSSDSSVYSDDEEDEDPAKEGTSREDRVISNLGEQIKGIVASNASLMKLSIIIRSSATRDDYIKAASKYNTWTPYPDISHVREKYGHAKHSTPWLLERLGKAITKRRQFLRYRVDHNDKMTGQDNMDKGNKPAKTIMASTKATTFIGDNVTQNVRGPASDGVNSWASQTSYEATNFAAEGAPRNLTVPSPPKFAFPEILFEYREPFQCPYCFTEQVVKNKAAWKKHVFRDLKPYICTFEECDLLMMRSRNEWFAHEIQNHRREWVCQFCQHPPFNNAATFSKHTKSSHGNILANSSLKALVLQSEEPVDKIPSTACPLCDEWEASVHRAHEQLESASTPATKSGEGAYGNLKVFRRHLGRHMEQLALFALPSNDAEQLDDESVEEEIDKPQFHDEQQMAEADSSNEDVDDENDIPHYYDEGQMAGDDISDEAAERSPGQVRGELHLPGIDEGQGIKEELRLKQLKEEKKKIEEEKKAARAQGAENVRKQVEADRKKAEEEAAQAAAKAKAAKELQDIKDQAAAEQKKLKEEAVAEAKKLKEEAAAETEKLKKAAFEQADMAKEEAERALRSAMQADHKIRGSDHCSKLDHEGNNQKQKDSSPIPNLASFTTSAASIPEPETTGAVPPPLPEPRDPSGIKLDENNNPDVRWTFKNSIPPPLYPPKELEDIISSSKNFRFANSHVGDMNNFGLSVSQSPNIHGSPAEHVVSSSALLNAETRKHRSVQEDLQGESSPRETASMFPSGTSKSTDQELVCEHPGCEKIFPNREKLRWHVRSHGRPFPCLESSCLSHGVAFSLRKDLVRHQESTHSGQRFYCKYSGCKYAVDGQNDGFSRKDNLARHIASQHPTVSDDDEDIKTKVTGNSRVGVREPNVNSLDDLSPEAVEERIRMIQQQNAMAFEQNSQFQPQTQQPQLMQQQYSGVSVQPSIQTQYQGIFPGSPMKKPEGEDIEIKR